MSLLHNRALRVWSDAQRTLYPHKQLARKIADFPGKFMGKNERWKMRACQAEATLATA
ncbi:hypothetical protein ACHMW7_06830 [Aminobacter sp. UC22_36]|uniref:hypothetical protein n=1 Tax=Aminobacter sp. UC22_36 TaxID=3374549 RepID=UPI00375727CF